VSIKYFLIEGVREVSLALKGGYTFETALFYPELCSIEKLKDLIPKTVNAIEVSKEVYEKLAYRSTTEGLLAVAKSKDNDLSDLEFRNENPLILIAEAPEKPGNIGAILRTADAANVDAVIIANPKTDLYNPIIPMQGDIDSMNVSVAAGILIFEAKRQRDFK